MSWETVLNNVLYFGNNEYSIYLARCFGDFGLILVEKYLMLIFAKNPTLYFFFVTLLYMALSLRKNDYFIETLSISGEEKRKMVLSAQSRTRKLLPIFFLS